MKNKQNNKIQSHTKEELDSFQSDLSKIKFPPKGKTDYGKATVDALKRMKS